ncbi:MAG: ribosome silencing factor [Acidobacteriota bacterium]
MIEPSAGSPRADRPEEPAVDTLSTAAPSLSQDHADDAHAAATDDAVPMSDVVRIAVDAALDRKAEALKILHLGAVSDFTDDFVICNGTNERQVRAIADNIEDQLRAAGTRPLHVEGYNNGRWVLLDYGNEMVIHIFLDDTRQHYDLERLWADGPDMTEAYLAQAA